MEATKNDTKRALNLKRSRDAIVRHITQNAQSWAKLQKEHTILKRENCGGVLYKENSWLDELKPEYATAPLSDFSALIQAIDMNLKNAVSGPNSYSVMNASRGKTIYRQWVNAEAKKVNGLN